MISWRKSRSGPHPVTPADAADLREAREARAKIEREIEASRSRWPVIEAAAAYLRRVHEENHLADDLRVIFTARRDRQ